MTHISKYFFWLAFIFLLLSCTSQQHSIKNINGKGRFANSNLIGMSENEFNKKFGAPIAKEIKIENNQQIESLIYADIFKEIIILSKVKFIKGEFIELSVDSVLDTKSGKLKKLEDEIQINRLQNFMDGVRKQNQ